MGFYHFDRMVDNIFVDNVTNMDHLNLVVKYGIQLLKGANIHLNNEQTLMVFSMLDALKNYIDQINEL